MPLNPGKTNQAVKSNIHELIGSGRPLKQAIAIALNVAGKSNKHKRTSVPKFKMNKPKY